MARLSRKVAIVTGAARGIGAAIATALAKEGAAVAFTDVDPEVQQLARSLRTAGLPTLGLLHDVTCEDSWEQILEDVERDLGPIDVVVNNAGILLAKPVSETSLADFQRVSSVNTEGVFLGIKYALAAMGTRGGSIINISSIAGLTGIASQMAYSASKGAVRLMTKSAVAEAASLGLPIRCNSIHPGVIETDMTKAQFGSGSTSSALAQMISKAIPSGRLGRPSDVAKVAVFLASDESEYVNGSELVIDGGILAGLRAPDA